MGLLILGCVSLLSGCGRKKPYTPDKNQKTEEVSKNPEEKMVRSYLTGERVRKSIGRRRPVAVMLNNIEEACPQSGISHASVIYEAPVEGRITRLMGIFEDYDGLSKIGSVRSCRDYFIFYAAGFDAVYCHYGQSVYAVPYLEKPEVDNLSGLTGYGDQVYYRTSDRKPPHNAYTSFDGIQKGIKINKYSQNYDSKYKGHYRFADDKDPVTLKDGFQADTVKPGGYKVNAPWFTYNQKTGLYDRFQYGKPQTDEENDEQISVKNIIIQNSKWENYDENGYLNIDVNTSGTGTYITNGKAVSVTWDKKDPWGPTYYYDEDGERITMNQGKTWVCIVLDTLADESIIE